MNYNKQTWINKIGTCQAWNSRTHTKGRKGYSLYSRIHPILMHPINTWQTHTNHELWDGLRILVNQFWTYWISSRTSIMLQQATLTHQNWNGSSLKFEEAYKKLEKFIILLADTSYTHASDRHLPTSSSLETRDGLRILVNQFWTCWIASRTSIMTYNSKLESTKMERVKLEIRGSI